MRELAPPSPRPLADLSTNPSHDLTKASKSELIMRSFSATTQRDGLWRHAGSLMETPNTEPNVGPLSGEHESEDSIIQAPFKPYWKKHSPNGIQLTCIGTVSSIYAVSPKDTGPAAEMVLDIRSEHGDLVAFHIGPKNSDKHALLTILARAYLAHAPVMISFEATGVPKTIAEITGVYLPPDHYPPPTTRDCLVPGF